MKNVVAALNAHRKNAEYTPSDLSIIGQAASGAVYYLPFGAIGTASQPMVNYLTAYPYGQIARKFSN
jgi:hypothetical protein